MNSTPYPTVLDRLPVQLKSPSSLLSLSISPLNQICYTTQSRIVLLTPKADVTGTDLMLKTSIDYEGVERNTISCMESAFPKNPTNTVFRRVDGSRDGFIASSWSKSPRNYLLATLSISHRVLICAPIEDKFAGEWECILELDKLIKVGAGCEVDELVTDTERLDDIEVVGKMIRPNFKSFNGHIHVLMIQVSCF
jgi:hypothetical protein